VKVFGRLHDDPIRARRRQAYEKRQWTKSREVERLQSGGLQEGLIVSRTLMTCDSNDLSKMATRVFQQEVVSPLVSDAESQQSTNG
jgi:hypothetical protein